ncbi:MAG: U32 family peptidase [Bacteroidales bacterium]|nr:U32 family peptidase [Bacteroidales bacterium]
MLSPRNHIELLAPARDLECALAAILHGADAIYVGAPKFSARKAASVSTSDIEQIVKCAHIYGARVFVALNTLLYDKELEEARNMAWEMYRIGVDALIVQDYALIHLKNMPPIELHSSTQMDNRNVDRVSFHETQGYKQIVLARELSLSQIKAIADKTHVRLEAFIHGALCVSYSGRCFMSQAVCGRSANRGECSQPCRLPYTILSSDGKKIATKNYALSLRDNNQTDNIERMMLAGISSFKIEGRLKDPAYVANITLHYRRIIDDILSRHPEFTRSSEGETVTTLIPDPKRSFNRGFTSFFMDGRQKDIHNPISPKSMGQPLGKACRVTRNSFSIENCDIRINNNDGLCFVKDNRLVGIKVNKVDGSVIYPDKMNDLQNGLMLYRNSDTEFDNLIKRARTTRQIHINISAGLAPNGDLEVQAIDLNGNIGMASFASVNLSEAKDPAATERIAQQQLAKTGGTAFTVDNVYIESAVCDFFVNASIWNELRRNALQDLEEKRIKANYPTDCPLKVDTSAKYPQQEADAEIGVLNNIAKDFLAQHGCTMTEWGYERQSDYKGRIVMTTKHCLMFAMGKCLKQHPEQRNLLPLTIIDEEHAGNRFSITCDCANCQMVIRML